MHDVRACKLGLDRLDDALLNLAHRERSAIPADARFLVARAADHRSALVAADHDITRPASAALDQAGQQMPRANPILTFGAAGFSHLYGTERRLVDDAKLGDLAPDPLRFRI